MFANVSPLWRKRLRLIVAAWALLLLVGAFIGSGASVREQVDAAEARVDMDALIGEAAAALTGSSPLAVGPLEAAECTVTPVRVGLSLSRTLQIAEASVWSLETLVDRFGLRNDPDSPVWGATTADYIGLRLTVPEAEPVGGKYAEPLEFRASTGCRPVGEAVGAFAPTAAAAPETGWRYGAVDCLGGGRLESWTEPVDAAPFAVRSTSEACV
ncbi:hypothetical protein [Glycomyces arizonensis]|uniref:hypothetical protein n=1 Tax=Glycomyces arizonensis TaxID=256035 RepID=UPI0004085496|nr:hypothetical protein [Glycomyces arizonensis]